MKIAFIYEDFGSKSTVKFLYTEYFVIMKFYTEQCTRVNICLCNTHEK